MTTANLSNLDEHFEALKQHREETKANLRRIDDEARRIENERIERIELAEYAKRYAEEHARHMTKPLEEEAEEMLRILEGDTAPTVSVSDVPPVDTEPPAPLVVPDAPVAPAGPPTAPQPAVDRPVPIGNTSILVVFVRWVRSWRILEWVLALLLAFIAFRVSGDHQSFGWRTGFWAHAQHFGWRTSWTLIGFVIGGFIGMWLRPRFDVIVTEARRANA